MGAFQRGFKNGLPIGLGYFSVSIGFGLLAVSGGLTIGQAVLLSMVNLTSAGQLAGVNIMFAGGSLVEMAVSQLFINMRYALMSLSLSQKLEDGVGAPGRMGIAFVITDEVFAVSIGQEGRVPRAYMAGLAVLPYLGWALGTLTGAVAGAVLPAVVRDGMGILLYAMFIAVIVPPAKQNASIRMAVLLAAALRTAFTFLPGLRDLSGGFAIVLCALMASVVCAIRRPIQEAM